MRNRGGYGRVVVTLLFFATTINYIDRQIIGLLKPVLEKSFQWSETDYSHIIMAFSVTYAIGLLAFGRLIDRIGTRVGYSLAITLWSCAGVLHALVRTTTGFVLARGFLGIGESGNFPAAIKVVAEWFPQRRRAFVTGLFNSGSSVGAFLAPVIVPLILGAFGWQMAFVITGGMGLVWLAFWLAFYRAPQKKRVYPEGVLPAGNLPDDEEQTADGDSAGRVTWRSLLSYRQTWAFIAGKFLTDPIWWFFLFWLPSYFSSTFALDLTRPSWQLATIYLATTIGGIGGGYLSSWLIKKGWPVFKARKAALLLAAFFVVPILFAKNAGSSWAAVALIGLAAAGHNAWSANLLTIVSDMFPKRMLSSVTGIGGMAGSVGGILFPVVTGYLLDFYKLRGNISAGYNILFVICGVVYLLAWVLIHLLAPKMERISVQG